MTLQQPTADIMVVDDTVANLRLLGELLKERGYRVRPFPSGALALRAAAKDPPDLILLDINMPDLNGFEVCQKMKEMPALVDVPIIFISALTETIDKVRAFSSGGVDYVTKPFHFEEVDARISTHLNLRRLRQQLEAQNQEIQESYDKLRTLEDHRDSLTHMIVHDMRNPLMVIQGYLQLLEMSTSNPALAEKSTRYIRDSIGATRSLVEMVSSLLDITKIESHELELDLSDQDLAELGRESARSMGALIEQKQLVLTAPGDQLPITCDGALILRVFNNLIGNAIKFTPANGSITVRVERSDDGARAFISDTGPGIPAEHHARIFEKFGQVQARSEGHKYSTGLGLTFCKMVVELHGGAIGLNSEPGQGTTFWFNLPITH